jgi:imidazolonepropionase-like amidohydrolase
MITQGGDQKRSMLADLETTPASIDRVLTLRRRLIKALHDGGVGLLLGSDAPQTYNVPGFSIHRELEVLVGAGLTPYQALETGTRNVAAFFGTLKEAGTIEVG